MTGRPRVIHPFLVAASPTLMLYSRNLGSVELSAIWPPMGLSLGASLAAYGALRAGRLDGARAGLIVSAALLLFFSFGLGVKVASRLGLARDRAGQERLTLGVEALALASVVGLLARRPALARTLGPASNAASIALVGFSMVGLLSQAAAGPRVRPPTILPPGPPSVDPRPGRLPDVYLIVLDAYGRSDVLRDLLGFDNGPFLGRLEARGFVVARRARANYCQTALSLASTLNLGYLGDLDGSDSADRRPLRRLIADNAAFRAFRRQGYRLVTFASGFDATESLDSDLTVGPPSSLATFPAMVADQTPLWLLLGRRKSHEPHQLHRDRVLKALDELPAASHPSGSPTLTFAHILAPHPPFVFGVDGQDVSGVEGSYTLNDSEGWRREPGHGGPEDYARRYREQLRFLNTRVEDAVDRILASSATPPIIVIQGDHGPGSRFESSFERPNDLRERMGILTACLVPEAARPLIRDDISPVNTLRVVLDACLGSKLGQVEDRSYYSSYLTPYRFIDVTGDLSEAAGE